MPQSVRAAAQQAEKARCVLAAVAKTTGGSDAPQPHVKAGQKTTPAARDALGRGMKAIGARLALAVNRVANRSGRVFADRYHLKLLPTPKRVWNALRYVLLNARRHAAKNGPLSAAPVRLDPASSARWFEGWKRKVPDADEPPAARPDSPAVAVARTWLLSVGWRRHGLLDPADVPG